jgi:hypothetical protein
MAAVVIHALPNLEFELVMVKARVLDTNSDDGDGSP